MRMFTDDKFGVMLAQGPIPILSLKSVGLVANYIGGVPSLAVLIFESRLARQVRLYMEDTKRNPALSAGMSVVMVHEYQLNARNSNGSHWLKSLEGLEVTLLSGIEFLGEVRAAIQSNGEPVRGYQCVTVMISLVHDRIKLPELQRILHGRSDHIAQAYRLLAEPERPQRGDGLDTDQESGREDREVPEAEAVPEVRQDLRDVDRGEGRPSDYAGVAHPLHVFSFHNTIVKFKGKPSIDITSIGFRVSKFGRFMRRRVFGRFTVFAHDTLKVPHVGQKIGFIDLVQTDRHDQDRRIRLLGVKVIEVSYSTDTADELTEYEVGFQARKVLLIRPDGKTTKI